MLASTTPSSSFSTFFFRLLLFFSAPLLQGRRQRGHARRLRQPQPRHSGKCMRICLYVFESVSNHACIMRACTVQHSRRRILFPSLYFCLKFITSSRQENVAVIYTVIDLLFYLSLVLTNPRSHTSTASSSSFLAYYLLQLERWTSVPPPRATSAAGSAAATAPQAHTCGKNPACVKPQGWR